MKLQVFTHVFSKQVFGVAYACLKATNVCKQDRTRVSIEIQRCHCYRPCFVFVLIQRNLKKFTCIFEFHKSQQKQYAVYKQRHNCF